MLYKLFLKSFVLMAIGTALSTSFAMGVRGHGKLCPYYKKSPYECSIPATQTQASSEEKLKSGQDK